MAEVGGGQRQGRCNCMNFRDKVKTQRPLTTTFEERVNQSRFEPDPSAYELSAIQLDPKRLTAREGALVATFASPPPPPPPPLLVRTLLPPPPPPPHTAGTAQRQEEKLTKCCDCRLPQMAALSSLVRGRHLCLLPPPPPPPFPLSPLPRASPVTHREHRNAVIVSLHFHFQLGFEAMFLSLSFILSLSLSLSLIFYCQLFPSF